MAGSISVGGKVIATHTGPKGAGTVSLGTNIRLSEGGGIQDSSGNDVLTESSGSVSFGNVIGGVPAGAIMSFAMSSAPAGWIVCNGAEYAIADYGDLHTAIGTTWGALTNGSGGAGSTHFRVPDLRGAFLRGSDSQTYTNTYDGGSVGDKNTDTAIAHSHLINGMASQGGGGGPYQYNLYLLRRYDGTTEALNQGGGTTAGDGIVYSTGRAGGSETKPFNATINYCIKY